MSWYNPQTWAEVTAAIHAGYVFNSTRLGVKADHAHLVCGHYSTRAMLSGHLDDFAKHIIESNDGVHERYMSSDRYQAQRPDDVAYFVTRDGNALAYITRAGDVVLNPRTDVGLPRYRNALRHLEPALKTLATRAAGGRFFES